jgi:hypothetical protein
MALPILVEHCDLYHNGRTAHEKSFVERRMKMKAMKFAIPLFAALAYGPVQAQTPILGSDLASFAILGGGGVTIGGTGSVISGSVGAYPTTSITGVIPTNFTISGGTVQAGGAVAQNAQTQLGTAMTALTAMGPGATPILGGLLGSGGVVTLLPGVYSSSSTMNLTGTLTLDGGGNANALWVFLVGSSLTTASSSVVNVINTGAGAGVYWVMGGPSGQSATLGSNSTFLGNILANQSITLGTNVTDSCGRLLTQVASVTLAGTDTIGTGCSGILAGSGGLSGGGVIVTGPGGGPVVTPIPEPEIYAMMAVGLGLLGWVGRRKKLKEAAAA